MEYEKNKTSTVILLAGGGVDSTYCMHLLNKKGAAFRCIHIDFGQPACNLEWQSVKDNSKRFGGFANQIKVASSVIFEGGEITGRNSALIFLALMHAQKYEQTICVGIHAGTKFYDCSVPFFEAMRSFVAEYTDGRVNLIAPLLNQTKHQIVEACIQANLDLNKTYSCQNGVSGGCGKCHSCLDRSALLC